MGGERFSGGATHLTPALSPLKDGEGVLTPAPLTPSPPHWGGEGRGGERSRAANTLRTASTAKEV
jgi:hypothetical protein